jgi:hypothetical protein
MPRPHPRQHALAAPLGAGCRLEILIDERPTEAALEIGEAEHAIIGAEARGGPDFVVNHEPMTGSCDVEAAIDAPVMLGWAPMPRPRATCTRVSHKSSSSSRGAGIRSGR